VAAFEQEKKQIFVGRREKSAMLEKQKAMMTATLQQQLADDKTTLESIRMIAQQYGVDFDEIRQRTARFSAPPSRMIRVSKLTTGN
jgi:hypothetical protein